MKTILIKCAFCKKEEKRLTKLFQKDERSNYTKVAIGSKNFYLCTDHSKEYMALTIRWLDKLKPLDDFSMDGPDNA